MVGSVFLLVLGAYKYHSRATHHSVCLPPLSHNNRSRKTSPRTNSRKRNGNCLSRKKNRCGPDAASKLSPVFPTTRCRLKLLKMEHIKDYLLLEEEFIQNQECLKPKATREEKNEEDRSKVDVKQHIFRLVSSWP
jgi:26S proteasome regulatory subunit T2